MSLDAYMVSVDLAGEMRVELVTEDSIIEVESARADDAWAPEE